MSENMHLWEPLYFNEVRLLNLLIEKIKDKSLQP
jgi:hypothetical protein